MACISIRKLGENDKIAKLACNLTFHYRGLASLWMSPLWMSTVRVNQLTLPNRPDFITLKGYLQVDLYLNFITYCISLHLNFYMPSCTYSWFPEHDYWCCTNGWGYSRCLCPRWTHATDQGTYSACTPGGFPAKSGL